MARRTKAPDGDSQIGLGLGESEVMATVASLPKAQKETAPAPIAPSAFTPTADCMEVVQAQDLFEGTEVLIRPEVDLEQSRWSVALMALAAGGELLVEEGGAGEVTLEKDGPPVTRNALLGLALCNGLDLLDRAGLEGPIRVTIEASTWINGVLKVSMNDWIRGNTLQMHYAPDAWVRFTSRMQAGPENEQIRVRWAR